MNLIVTLIFLQITAWTQATNATEDTTATNKTKRTIANQVQTYGENRPVLLYPDNPAPPTFYAPVTIKPVFDPEVPKQVAAQQVLYEFQQTPTNAVSNVHVNQFYQPVGSKPENPLPANTGPAQFISSSESVAAPVQHSALIRHGQNFAQVQFQPQHIQTQQYVPGKYLYVNGKILYQPNQAQTHPNGFQRPVNFLYMHPQSGTQKFIPQAPLVRPMGYRRFHPPQPHQLQKITKPMNVPEVVEEQLEEEPAEENVENNKEEEAEEEEENDDKESEESDDDDHYFSKYSSFDEDDDDHGNYREEDEDEDNERGSSRTVPKKHKKKGKPGKYSKSNNYKYSENYSSSSKYDKKKGKKGGKPAPKMQYKSVKYVKEGNNKPKFEKIEGKQSQNVPVVHKQKIFREKWFVTKSTDDSITK